MSMTDPIADMLTRIRNAIAARKPEVIMPTSTLKHRIAELLQKEGFLERVQVVSKSGSHGELVIYLKYRGHLENAIQGIRRISRPGQRTYAGHDQLPRVRSGLGLSILSTSKGLLTDKEARKQKIGGEVLCEIW